MRWAGRRTGALVLLGAFSTATAPVRAAPDVSGGAPLQQFVPPPPGSYTLPVIQPGPAGEVLGSDGRPARLASFTQGGITLLTLMYTYCTDPIGCPLAFSTFAQLRERLLSHPGLGRRIRFVSLSFDPGNDTPEVMRRYAGKLGDPVNLMRWHFLTTASVRQLQPIADDLGQEVRVQRDRQGQPTRLFNHMLKVFLLDSQGRVREIYSPAFLHADVIYNDMATLVMEQARGSTPLAIMKRQRSSN